MWHYRRVLAQFQIVLQLLTDLAGIISLAVRRQRALAAEVLMLRRQLALYVERGVKPRERRASIRNLATKFVGPCKDPHPRGSALVTRRAINTAFVPPNANELVITASIPTADRASLGT
jgi:hypothetical protein